jgi:hypothetical protein
MQLSKECNKKHDQTWMQGNEWKFLCTQHGKDPKNCCAIDYVSHNVEATMKVLLIPSLHQTDSI